MSLSAHEQQALDSIEDELAGTAPELAARLATFTRLASGEEMPARERVRPGRQAAKRIGGRFRGLLPRLGRQRTMLLVWLTVAIGLIAFALVLNHSVGRAGQGQCSPPWQAVCAGQALARGVGLVVPPGPSLGV